MLTILDKELIFEICEAYESGYHDGCKAISRPNPYYVNDKRYFAYILGFDNGALSTGFSNDVSKAN